MEKLVKGFLKFRDEVFLKKRRCSRDCLKVRLPARSSLHARTRELTPRS